MKPWSHLTVPIVAIEELPGDPLPGDDFYMVGVAGDETIVAYRSGKPVLLSALEAEQVRRWVLARQPKPSPR